MNICKCTYIYILYMHTRVVHECSVCMCVGCKALAVNPLVHPCFSLFMWRSVLCTVEELPMSRTTILSRLLSSIPAYLFIPSGTPSFDINMDCEGPANSIRLNHPEQPSSQALSIAVSLAQSEETHWPSLYPSRPSSKLPKHFKPQPHTWTLD